MLSYEASKNPFLLRLDPESQMAEDVTGLRLQTS